MARRALTFEQVDKIVQKADLAKLRRGAPRGARVAPAEIATTICSTWAVAGPIIHLVAGMPLIPKKWRDALGAFVDILDKICS